MSCTAILRRAVLSRSSCRNCLSASTSSQASYSSTPATEESQSSNRDSEFVNDFSKLKPSEKFLKSLTTEQLKKTEKLLPELEIYAYMGTFVPKFLHDVDWQRFISINTLNDRIAFLEYLALKQRREEQDKEKKRSKHEAYLEQLSADKIRFENGEMAYGPEMYQLFQNPLRNTKKINHIEGSRYLRSLRLPEVYPNIAIDMQFMQLRATREASLFGKQLQYVISENLASRTPFPLTLINMNCNKKEEARQWLGRNVGFYNTQYTHQQVLPDFTSRNVKETFPTEFEDQEIIYISKHSRTFLDGPLTSSVIVLPCTRDIEKESLGAARRSGIRFVRLPIQKYVKWVSGPMYLPLPNIMRVFREVYDSGGDWASALNNNVSKRHLRTADEREAMQGDVTKRKMRLQERAELARYITDATGNT